MPASLLDSLPPDERALLVEADPPNRAQLMKAVLHDEPFTDPSWVFERKLDGIRCLAVRDGTEDVRLLSIADFDRKSPFGLILAGHPVLDDRLAEPTHHALDQRITTVARLAPLSLDETRDYIRLRLDASGARGQPVFDDDAVAALFDVGAGVPRRLNRAASSAMIVAASRKKNTVAAQDVHDARVDRGRA